MAQPRTVRSDKAPSILLNFRVSAEDKRRIDRIAKRRGITASQLMRSALLKELEQTA
jgi:predicted transcriptional regulator